MTEDYVLCSSSTEEGEIQESTRYESVPNKVFPRNISILKDWYLPHTQIFIGNNSIPLPTNYPDGLTVKKLKNKLRKDIPPPFNLISCNKDKSFFNNKFELLSEENIKRNKLKTTDFKLANTYEKQIKVVETFDHISNLFKNQYCSMCDIFSFDDRRHEVAPNVADYPKCVKFILTRDSIIDKLDNPNVFVFFRVIKSRNGVSYVFEDFYHRKILFYEYLDLYFDEVMGSKNSTDMKTYVAKNTFIVVFSSSVFKKEGTIYRYYDGLDVDKNFISVINLKNIEIRKVNLTRKNNFEFIVNLELEEGDYAINNWKIYKLGVQGVKHEYEGLILEDFQ